MWKKTREVREKHPLVITSGKVRGGEGEVMSKTSPLMFFPSLCFTFISSFFSKRRVAEIDVLIHSCT